MYKQTKTGRVDLFSLGTCSSPKMACGISKDQVLTELKNLAARKREIQQLEIIVLSGHPKAFGGVMCGAVLVKNAKEMFVYNVFQESLFVYREA